jgi:hypothetical protein
MRAATAPSTAACNVYLQSLDLHEGAGGRPLQRGPFAVPHDVDLAAWRPIRGRLPDLCPHPADGYSAPAAAQLAQLPTLVRSALSATGHAELVRLLPTNRARALLHSITTLPGSMWLAPSL